LTTRRINHIDLTSYFHEPHSGSNRALSPNRAGPVRVDATLYKLELVRCAVDHVANVRGSGGTRHGPFGKIKEATVLIAFSVTPIGVGEGVAEEVAEAVRVVRESGLPNRTDAMFTTIEGDWDEAMAVVKRAVEAVAARAPRVSLVLKADLRPGVTGALTAKVEAVERYLEG
jgi:uncharacterized protein (TIGR00106 family)